MLWTATDGRNGAVLALLHLPALPTQGPARRLARGGVVTGRGSRQSRGDQLPLSTPAAPADSQSGPPSASPRAPWRIRTDDTYPVTVRAQSLHRVSHLPAVFMSVWYFPPFADKETSSERAGNMPQATVSTCTGIPTQVCLMPSLRHTAKCSLSTPVLTAMLMAKAAQHLLAPALCQGSARCSPTLTSTVTLCGGGCYRWTHFTDEEVNMQSWDPLSQACATPNASFLDHTQKKASGSWDSWRGDLGGEPASTQW